MLSTLLYWLSYALVCTAQDCCTLDQVRPLYRCQILAIDGWAVVSANAKEKLSHYGNPLTGIPIKERRPTTDTKFLVSKLQYDWKGQTTSSPSTITFAISPETRVISFYYYEATNECVLSLCFDNWCRNVSNNRTVLSDRQWKIFEGRVPVTTQRVTITCRLDGKQLCLCALDYFCRHEAVEDAAGDNRTVQSIIDQITGPPKSLGKQTPSTGNIQPPGPPGFCNPLEMTPGPPGYKDSVVENGSDTD